MAIDLLQGLNPAQREAVETIQGPLLILAGPGSGKTRVIAHRVAYLVKVCGVRPHSIMAVTFTNKAAREMRERIFHLLGQTVEDISVGTFHALCARILRIDGEHIGLGKAFVIYDGEDQLSLVKRSMEEVGVDPKNFAPKAIHSAIGAAKSQLLGPQEHAHHRQTYFDEIVQRVYRHYEELLAQSKAVDFDDLLLKTVRLFQLHPSALQKYQSRYLYILVDEFQDTNLVQYVLAKLLAQKHRNICVVGDPDQSIYSWRYADLRNILNFEKDYPDAKVVYLEQNYRSTQTILEAAHHLISANVHRKEKGLWTENEVGIPLAVKEAYNEEEEAHFVVSEVDRLVKEEKHGLKDFAIMYRTNAQSRALEEVFLRYGIPYRLVGALRFYERREVKDIIAYLRLIHNPYDDVSLAKVINVPSRGIGQKTLVELTGFAKAHSVPLYTALQMITEGLKTKGTTEGEKPYTSLSPRIAVALESFLSILNELIGKSQEQNIVRLLDTLLEQIGFRTYLLGMPDGEERWENIMELRATAGECEHLPPEEGLSAFLEGVMLVSDVDNLDEKADAVTLITLHQAKGLEFPIVFIVGMEEGLLPHIRSFDDPAQMEEERRLCYVGITRAKERVYLVRAFRRSFTGTNRPNLPSRFLADIPSRLIASSFGGEQHPKVEARTPSRVPAKPVFKAGDKVRHAKFGDGIVVSCIPSGDDQEVTVSFKGEARLRRLLLSFAPLEKLA
ncbi:MAG: UvrD-helicase domain-containing protein [Chloroflexi bacterium]|nr:UvrD-helicase domain-containing protein [Chloroflexota bacterium]